jgi:DNA-cytosine methyltransferase
MFKTIDLFTGIGGISYSLRDLLDVKAYCEINPNSQKVLKCRMSSEHIQSAPIINDVKDYNNILKVTCNQTIDLLISSSSCIGFSIAGSREGLENNDTKLMHDSLNLIRRIKPKMIFMENVPGIIHLNKGRDLDFLLNTLKKLNYSIKWEVHSASDIGAWHIRKRWFCLCVHESYKLKDISNYKLPRYQHWNSDILYSVKKSKLRSNGDNDRLRLLGNSVVPDCVRTAFFSLYSKFAKTIFFPFSTGLVKKEINIIIDPCKQGIEKSEKKRNRTSKLITSEKVLKFYPTPRCKNISASCILTERCSKDLGTIVKFEKNNEWYKNYCVNPIFVEILMGFPLNYTYINIT